MPKSQFTALAFVCLLLLILASPAPVTAAPQSSKQAATSIAKQFWIAMFKQDLKAIKSLVETPFAWDSPCALKLTMAGLLKHIKTGPPAPKYFKLVKIREITAKTKWVHPYTIKLIQRFAQNATPKSCGAKYKAAQAIIASRKHSYVMVDMHVGSQLVPTLTRLSLIKGKWLVTGFDN